MQHVAASGMTSSSPLKPGQFEAIRDALAQYGGVYLDQTNLRTLVQGLQRRLAATGLGLDAYIARIVRPGGRNELQELAELVLNHETIFFRNMQHMQALGKLVLPQLHRRKPSGEPLRVWSAGCATGEEPYSLAIVALESLGSPPPRPVHIWATDLSRAALARAQRGIYRGRSLTNVKAEMYHHYFEHRRESWMLREHVRALVTFDRLNLLDPFPEHVHGVDIIFCQNVTIYFQLATFRHLVERFYDMLPEGGMLFLGFSETLWNVFDKLHLREIGGAFVYVKEARQHHAAPPPAATAPPRKQPLPPTSTQRRNQSGSEPRAPRTITQRAAAYPQDDSDLLAETLPLRKVMAAGATRPLNSAQPTEPDTVRQGRALLADGRVDEALAMLYQVPLDGPHAPHALALIARAHANRGHADLAVAEARRALELDSLTAEAYLLLGVLYVQQGQLQEATQQLERARYLEPDSALVSYHLADAYRQLQRRDIALREYHNTLRKLAACPQHTMLDGVAIDWLRGTCERYIKLLGHEQR